MRTENCPDERALVDYLLGKVPDDRLASLETHFAACDWCEETIRGLSASDTLSQLVAEAIGETTGESSVNEQELVAALIQTMQVPPSAGRHHLDDRAAEVTRLLESAPDDSSIGQLAHYRIIKLIGAGSSGVVYQAMDQQLHRMVALKILRPSLGSAARQRFLAEARSAAAMDHPNVITIFHVGAEGSLAYMAMQWLPGETLQDRLERVTLLPEDEVRQMATEIAAGLAAAHEKNLIHRDIKPANIWIRQDTGHAIILDFGLARIADDDPQMTNTGMLAGTPNFMSPEQSRGLELDGRSDLFSLGCLLYRSATGKLPFGSTGILSTLQSIQNDAPRPPRQLNATVSEDFSDLVMCLLEKQPVNRPENASQLITALKSPRSQWPFVATRASIQPQPPVVARTQPRSVWLRWVVVALMIGLLGWAGVRFGPQILRIVTDQGQLVIETNDEDVIVQVLANGQQVQVIDTETQESINIKAGEYQIQIKDNRNVFELNPDRITMTRGGKQIVTITRIQSGTASAKTVQANSNALESGSTDVLNSDSTNSNLDRATEQSKVVQALSAQKSEVCREIMDTVRVQYEEGEASYGEYKQAELDYLNAKLEEMGVITGATKGNDRATFGGDLPTESSQPTFEGRTFQEWQQILQTERSRETIRRGINALAELALQNPDLQQAAIATVTPLVRKYGSNEVFSSEDDLAEEIDDFFGFLPPERTVSFAIEEIENGTLQSRKQMNRLLLGLVYQRRPELMAKCRAEVRKRWKDILSVIIHLMENSKDEQQTNAANLLGVAVRTMCVEQQSSVDDALVGGYAAVYGRMDHETEQFLISRIQATKDFRVAAQIASTAVACGSDSDDAVQCIATALADPNTDVDVLMQCFNAAAQVDQAWAPQLIEPLIELFKNERQCAELAKRRFGSGEFGGGGGGFGGGGGVGTRVSGLEMIQKMILSQLGGWGSAAEAALPFLNTIQTGALAEAAREAAEKIRTALE